MKVTREKSEENRQTVIETSGRLFREMGFDGVGVSTLMQAAGLTHGGFYKHFRSKDDLMAQATKAASDRSTARLKAVADQTEAPRFQTILRHYLSEAHRDAPGQGCTLAALGADATRHGPELHQVMGEAVTDHLDLLEMALAHHGGERARDLAVASLATMVGALMLSRAVADPALSRELLDTPMAMLLELNAER